MVPAAWYKSFINYRILSRQFGQYQTMQKWACLDAQGNAIPWYTYPAIEYIKQIDFSQKLVFEYGSGNSSAFWAKRCKNLVAVEDDEQWYNKVKTQLPANADYRFAANQQEYTHAIHHYNHTFDVIIIDGSHRYECAVEALKKLAPGGIIILDNADWKQKTAALLRGANLIEVDMAGFGPINDYTWTTSFFFSRDVQLAPLHQRQPIHGTGGAEVIEA